MQCAMRPHRFMRTALFTALSVIDDADGRRTRRLALGPVEDPLRLSTAVDPMGDPAQSTTAVRLAEYDLRQSTPLNR